MTIIYDSVDAVVARAEELMALGLIKATNTGREPKREGTGRNFGKGAAFEWLCKEVGNTENKCNFWPFSKNSGFPAAFGHRGNVYKPGRLMCLLANGPPPSDKHRASYTCNRGNKGCIHPKHLVWKTLSEARRGQPNVGRRGKISPVEAEEIRLLAKTKPIVEIAPLFRLSPQRTGEIVRGHGFSRPRKVWVEQNGRFYPRISFGYKSYQLGGFSNSEQAFTAYVQAFERLRRGEPAKPEPRETSNPVELRRFHTNPTIRFENEGERVIAVDPDQEQSMFVMHHALDKLHPSVRKFVLVASDTGDLDAAREAAGLNQAQVAMLLPRLRVFLGSILH